MNFAVTITGLIYWAIQGLIVLIILDIIISWCLIGGVRLSPYQPIIKGIRSIVNPVLAPVRRILPSPSKTAGWDLSPMLTIFLLEIIQGLVVGNGLTR